ncbi:hypothetical protein Ait01nite_039810 [Actinoplanes italicus]|uniref:Uncharacterized protein n=1 Tax=Actinoplanes italicus TaxID=113567 RepID=A0A2T0JWD9_9ACTN|nr:hypothetical protein [Actinoplanes italicus]PRX11995.1 hypothetical protein CLV67_13019 [Actinoplanes italicus]GIE30936.1 hypothetical protein Ait01nite_039810 [Actinoplanes italicus]
MPEILSTTDFDLPVTEEFLNRVQRGVRRRRAFRLTVASCAVLAVTGGVFAVARPHEPAPPAPATVLGPAPVVIGHVERYRIGFVPDGITLDPRLSSSTLIISQDGEEVTDGRPAGPLDTPVMQSTRRFEKANGGSYLWITVSRPFPQSPGQGSAILLNTLANRSTAGSTPVETFSVPAGTAHLTRKAEGYGVVIMATDLSVITIEANTQVPAEELKAVAVGLTPA